MPGTTLGTAYVQIAPSADGIGSSLEQICGGAGEKGGTSFGSKLVKFAGKAMAAAGVAKLIKDTFDIGGKLQQSYIGGIETIYNGAEDLMRENARAAAEAGISMNDYAEQAISFGAALKQSFGKDITGAAKAADQAIMDMADNSAKMGTDIQSVQAAYQGFAKQNYTMLDNLKLGYGGTKQEMERLLAHAEELTGIHYDIDNLGDVYAAIHEVQEELHISGTAAGEAATTFSGSMNAMKAAAENLMGNIALGQNVEESLQTLLGTVQTFFMGNLIPMVGTIIRSLPGVIVTIVRDGIPMLLSDMMGLLSDFVSSVKEFAGSLSSEKIAEWAKTSGVQMLKNGAEMLLNFVTGLVSNIGQLLAALGRIGIEIVKGLGSAIWDKVKAAGEKVKEKFLEPINALRDKVHNIVEKIKGFFTFKISIPNIPLPHFGIKPSGWKLGDLLKGSIPSLAIDWYAKGGIMTKPTLFGGGEAGDEAIMPLDPFWDKMDRLAKGVMALAEGSMTVNVYGSPGMDVNQLASAVEQKIISSQKRRAAAWL